MGSHAIPSAITTKILALGHLSSDLKPDQRAETMKQEVPATLLLYLSGKIDQWFARQDSSGVVFLLNLNTIEDARSLMGTLPLGVTGLMTFEFIPLGPLSPFALLIG
jgi:hypothetical protein